MSSRTTADSPLERRPSIRLPVPYSLACFRTMTYGVSVSALVTATRGTAPSATPASVSSPTRPANADAISRRQWGSVSKRYLST